VNATTLAEKPVSTPVPPAAKVTQARVLASEWVKFRSLRSSYVALAATFVSMIGFGILFTAVTVGRWPLMDVAARAKFDPTQAGLRGTFLAQLIIGVLGVLVVTGEYSTGMIRASLSAVATRLPLLWAKALVFAAVTWVATTVSSFAAFLAGQAILSSQHIETTLSAPGVFRAVMGAGLYLTVVGLLGVALGWLLRHAAGAIGTLFGILLVLPLLAEALPDSWAQHVDPYLPNVAGQVVFTVHPEAGLLAPWTGFAVFCGYAAVALAGAAVLLRRRDA
jgi:ABC-2 type transport system permease protein